MGILVFGAREGVGDLPCCSAIKTSIWASHSAKNLALCDWYSRACFRLSRSIGKEIVGRGKRVLRIDVGIDVAAQLDGEMGYQSPCNSL